jgi:hypothetical protein
VSKQPEIYVSAANYLQTLDWRSSPEFMKTIITFYRRAKAYESLALFYQSCAQVEIDECQDYEKALSALQCASQSLARADNNPSAEKHEEDNAALVKKVQIVEAFVTARRLLSTTPNQALEICQTLMQEEPVEIEEAIRLGDVYAMVVEYYHALGNDEVVSTLLEQMKERGIDISFYINEAIWKGLIDITSTQQTRKQFNTTEELEEDEDAIAEEFGEESPDGEIEGEDDDGEERTDLFVEGRGLDLQENYSPPQQFDEPNEEYRSQQFEDNREEEEDDDDEEEEFDESIEEEIVEEEIVEEDQEDQEE